jgi:hypothetical protein
MEASLSRKFAKSLFAPLLAAGILFAPSFGGVSNSNERARVAAPLISFVVDKVESLRGAASAQDFANEFAKEQAMSPHERIDRWTPFIKEASRRFKISEEWIRAVMRMESGGRTLLDETRPIVSSAGAVGVMQVMPGTYDEMRRQYGLGADPYNPHDNVLAGAAYLRWLYGKYGYPKMFAAYNAGPGTLAARLADGGSLPDETRAYVSGITRLLGGGKSSSPRTAKMLATLTRPDGSPVTVDGTSVDSIRAALPDEYAPGVQTVIGIGHIQQGVREDIATVESLIGSHGGRV